MGGAGVDRPPSLICPRASAWRAAFLPSLHGERLAQMCRGSRSLRGEQRPGQDRPTGPAGSKDALACKRDPLRIGPKPQQNRPPPVRNTRQNF